MATNQKVRYTFQDAAKRRKVRDYICDVIVAGSSANFQEYVLLIWNSLEQEFQQDIPSPTSKFSFSNLTKMVEEHQQIWWNRAANAQREQARQQAEKLAIEQAKQLAIEQARQQEQAKQQEAQQAIQQERLKTQRLKQRAEKAKQRFFAEINQMQAAFRFHHPHECKRCPERFSSNTKLHLHIAEHHTKKSVEKSPATAPTASPPAKSAVPNLISTSPPSGVSTYSPSSSPEIYAEIQASSPLPAAPPSQTPSPEIPARSSHKSRLNSSLSPVTPRQTNPAAPLSLTPPLLPGIAHRDLNRSPPSQPIILQQFSPLNATRLSKPASIIENPRQESPAIHGIAPAVVQAATPVSPRSSATPSSPRSTLPSPQSLRLSPRTAKAIKKASRNVIDKPRAATASLPASRPSSPVFGTKKHESAAMTTVLGRVTSPPPTPRPSSPASGTGRHETSPASPLNAPYVPPHKRQNSYITIGDLFAKYGACPRQIVQSSCMRNQARVSALPRLPSPLGIIRRSYMTMHELLTKFRGSNSHGSKSHGSSPHSSNSPRSNSPGSKSHGSMFERNSSNQEQALISVPNSQIPALIASNYTDQSEASLAARSGKSDSACLRNSASIATSPTPFRPPPAYMHANHSYRQSSSPSASPLTLSRASPQPWAHSKNWRDDLAWRTQNSTSFSLERLLESLLHAVRDTGHTLHIIQLR